MKYQDARLGAECGGGWLGLVDPLIERCKAENVEIIQIKEKFGALRFYVGSCNEDLRKAIEEAERQSGKICEFCGEPGEIRQLKWLKTLCDKHYAERQSDSKKI